MINKEQQVGSTHPESGRSIDNAMLYSKFNKMVKESLSCLILEYT
jgi:hypothetical protein